MSENKDKKLDGSSSKDLLYSEMLNTSVADHVHELLHKKKISSTFHVQRSPVLDRVSELMQSLKETEKDVKNVEIIQDGEISIDMYVTILGTKDENEHDSDDNTRNADFGSELKVRKLIIRSDSDSELSENESEKNVLDNKNMVSDSDRNERLEFVLKGALPCQESDVDLEPCNLGFGLTTSVSSDSSDEYESELHDDLGCSGEKKRKLISVIEEVDEQNICLSGKRKRVGAS